MGRVFDGIDDGLAAWIRAQHVFFVGTAPLAAGGHVNVSPKGPIGTLRILGPRRVAYLDLVGSGAETVAHLRENGRIVVMLCAFAGPPRIVRLHGRGRVVQIGAPGFEELRAEMDLSGLEAARDGARAVIVVDVRRVADSCGYGVPRMRYEGMRPQQADWVGRKRRTGPDALMDYVADHNASSVDGLEAFCPDMLPRGGSPPP